MRGLTNKEALDLYSHPEPNSGCWLWTAAVNRKGYGVTHDRNKNGWETAYRLSYMEYIGAIPNGLHVCHKCDTPACVNPEHLFIGTCKDNHSDSKRKGRRATGAKNGSYTKQNMRPKGDRHGCSKITQTIAAAIRASTADTALLAHTHHLSRSTIQRIKAGKLWRSTP